MEEALERLFTYLGANAFREFGWPAVCVVVMAFVVLRFLIGLTKFAWAKRKQIWERLLPGRHKDQRVRSFNVVFPTLTLVSILIFPSNPIVAALFMIGLIVLALEVPQDRPFPEAMHYAILACTLVCLALTIGGIVHDVIWPPTARCSDGSYSSSTTRQGTCSWHGGVGEWNPDPWWRPAFK